MEVIIDSRFTAYLALREKALKKRDKASLYRLAQVYSGMKGKKSKKKAYELYKLSAAYGYAEAQFMMGLCNEKGIGVKQSIQIAISWYIRAEISAAADIADSSHFTDEAQRELLHIFRDDPRFAEETDDAAFVKNNTSENIPTAEILYAAEQGSENGIHHLAQFYKLSKRYEEAVIWYRRYAKLRIGQRKRLLGW